MLNHGCMDRRDTPIDVEIVLPVFNEERVLADSVHRIHRFLTADFPFSWRILIADNASTDLTPDIASQLAAELTGVRVMRLGKKGRGRALRAAWSSSDARVVTYMDVDLSTDLRGLLPLVASLLSGHSDLAIGTRLAGGSRVVRGVKREVISRSYNRILRTVLRVGFSDAQCGFKAARTDVLSDLLPAVQDQGWFFDTELLVVAQRRGLRIHEVPVDWVDDPDSRVDIVSTAIADLKGVARLVSDSHFMRFIAVGIVSTLAYAVIFLGFRGMLGAAGANVIALALTAIGNTLANRRLTFQVRGRDRLLRQCAMGMTVFFATLALTTGALVILQNLDPRPSRAVELIVLIAASVAATISRYVALRSWVFASTRKPGNGPDGPGPQPLVASSAHGAINAVRVHVPSTEHSR